MSTRRWLLLILLVAALFRFLWLTTSPPALNWDEVSIGYNAYSILKTGRDEWGARLPLAFTAFGETKLPAMIYASIPGIAIFGLTDFGVRVTPAIIGILAVYLIYVLTKELIGEKYAPWAALLLAISPWHVHLSRASFEAGLALVFLMTAILYFHRALANSRLLPLSAVFAVLSMYSYNSARIVLPLLIVTLVIIYRKKFPHPRHILISLILGAILLLPSVTGLNNPESLVRWRNLDFSASESFELDIAESRRYTPLPSPIPQLIHNKVTHYVHTFFLNYIKTFSTNFLLFEGSAYTQRSVQGMGLLYFFELPLLVVGLFQLSKFKRISPLILAWLIIAPIPSAITIDSPSSLRALSLLPPLLVLEAIGLTKLLPHVRRNLLVAIFVIWNIGYFGYRLFGVYPIKYSDDWQYGYAQTVKEIMSRYNDVDKIYFTSSSGEPYIFVLFYGRIDPHSFQTDPNLRKSKDPTGWIHVDSFDKFEFVDLNAEFYKPPTVVKRTKGNLLFIGKMTELGGLESDWSIRSPNWQATFEMGQAEGQGT